MIYERGRVTRRSGTYAFVSSEGQRFCVRCAEGRGCGGGLMAQILGKRLFEVRARTSDPAIEAGDEVLLGIHGSALLRLSALVYLVPVLCLTAGAWLGALSGEIGSVLLAIAGFAGGLLMVHAVSRYHGGNPGWEPVVVRRLDRPAARF